MEFRSLKLSPHVNSHESRPSRMRANSGGTFANPSRTCVTTRRDLARTFEPRVARSPAEVASRSPA
eukprot:882921-Prymnesium_polylepis.1